MNITRQWQNLIMRNMDTDSDCLQSNLHSFWGVRIAHAGVVSSSPSVLEQLQRKKSNLWLSALFFSCIKCYNDVK